MSCGTGVVAPTNFNTSPASDQQLRFKVSLVANALGSVAQLYTQNDQALGYTIMFALQNATGKYWDENLAFYNMMKGSTIAMPTLTKEQFETAVSRMRVNLFPGS